MLSLEYAVDFFCLPPRYTMSIISISQSAGFSTSKRSSASESSVSCYGNIERSEPVMGYQLFHIKIIIFGTPAFPIGCM